MTTITHQCRGCDTAIELTDYGWVHVIGGGASLQKCIDCGWKGSRPGGYRTCPECSSEELLEDHVAEV